MTDRDETIEQLRRHGIAVSYPEPYDNVMFDDVAFEAEGCEFVVTDAGAIVNSDGGSVENRRSVIDAPIVDLTDRPDSYVNAGLCASRTWLTDDLWAVTLTDDYSLLRAIMTACHHWELDERAALASLPHPQPEADIWHSCNTHTCDLGDWLVRYGVAPAVSRDKNTSATLRIEDIKVVVEDRALGEPIDISSDRDAWSDETDL